MLRVGWRWVLNGAIVRQRDFWGRWRLLAVVVLLVAGSVLIFLPWHSLPVTFLPSADGSRFADGRSITGATVLGTWRTVALPAVSGVTLLALALATTVWSRAVGVVLAIGTGCAFAAAAARFLFDWRYGAVDGVLPVLELVIGLGLVVLAAWSALRSTVQDAVTMRARARQWRGWLGALAAVVAAGWIAAFGGLALVQTGPTASHSTAGPFLQVGMIPNYAFDSDENLVLSAGLVGMQQRYGVRAVDEDGRLFVQVDASEDDDGRVIGGIVGRRVAVSYVTQDILRVFTLGGNDRAAGRAVITHVEDAEQAPGGTLWLRSDANENPETYRVPLAAVPTHGRMSLAELADRDGVHTYQGPQKIWQLNFRVAGAAALVGWESNSPRGAGHSVYRWQPGHDQARRIAGSADSQCGLNREAARSFVGYVADAVPVDGGGVWIATTWSDRNRLLFVDRQGHLHRADVQLPGEPESLLVGPKGLLVLTDDEGPERHVWRLQHPRQYLEALPKGSPQCVVHSPGQLADPTTAHVVSRPFTVRGAPDSDAEYVLPLSTHGSAMLLTSNMPRRLILLRPDGSTVMVTNGTITRLVADRSGGAWLVRWPNGTDMYDDPQAFDLVHVSGTGVVDKTVPVRGGKTLTKGDNTSLDLAGQLWLVPGSGDQPPYVGTDAGLFEVTNDGGVRRVLSLAGDDAHELRGLTVEDKSGTVWTVLDGRLVAIRGDERTTVLGRSRESDERVPVGVQLARGVPVDQLHLQPGRVFLDGQGRVVVLNSDDVWVRYDPRAQTGTVLGQGSPYGRVDTVGVSVAGGIAVVVNPNPKHRGDAYAQHDADVAKKVIATVDLSER